MINLKDYYVSITHLTGDKRTKAALRKFDDYQVISWLEFRLKYSYIDSSDIEAFYDECTYEGLGEHFRPSLIETLWKDYINRKFDKANPDRIIIREAFELALNALPFRKE